MPVAAEAAATVRLLTATPGAAPSVELRDSGALLALDRSGPAWAVRAHNASADEVGWDVGITAPSCLEYALETLVVPCTADDADEPNDTLAQATDRTQGDGLCVRPGADDHYRLGTVNAGQQVVAEIRFLHAAGDLDLELLDGSGTLLAGTPTVTDDEHVAWTNSGPDPTDVYARIVHWPTAGATCRNNTYAFGSAIGSP